MDDSSTHNDGECGATQELIAWYPTRVLDERERRLVDEHAAECEACGDLLRFSSDLQKTLQEQYARHPAAAELVGFVEDKSSMTQHQRSAIEDHLNVCPSCKEQAVMLETVGRDASREDETRGAEVRRPPTTIGTRRPGFWEVLRGGLFGPVPAAVYLAVALLAVGLHVFGPGGWVDVSPRTDLTTGALGSVVILPDETDRVRQSGGSETEVTSIDAASPQFLLIELTGLAAPPPAADVYTVEFLREDASVPVWEAEASGRTFRDNYTLCLSLGALALAPDRYLVRVVDPGGDVVYRSTLVVR